MSEQIIRRCDICGKEIEGLSSLSNVVINVYERGLYEKRPIEHYCADFDVCYECAEKYKLPRYGFVSKKIEFVKENGNFLSKLWKFVKNHKEDRE